MFVADPGYGFGYFDLSQAEARYVAWDADIKTWIEQFERARIDGSYDAHRALASDMFNVPYDEVPTKDRNADWSPTIRYIAKRCRHGLNYRMGADKLATVTGLPSWQAQEAYNIYHNKTPELRVWWDRITHTVREKRVLFNSLGRRLLFLNRLTDMSGGANETSALDSIIAFRPQSTIGDKVVEVWRKSESDPEWPVNARICLNIHDALIVIAPIVRLMKCIQIMKRYAEEPIIVESIVSREKRPMIIPAETKISYPTIWNVNDEGKLEFTEDRSGLHRWSHMRKVEVTC